MPNKDVRDGSHKDLKKGEEELLRIQRRKIVAEIKLKGGTYRDIQSAVKTRMHIETYSLATVKKDWEACLKEFQQERIENTEQLVTLELQRIDKIIVEAWEAWEKSKKAKSTEKKGTPRTAGEIATLYIKEVQTAQECGDPRYLDVIHKQLMERRKLLGLYAPEKHDVTGDLSFAQLLMQTGVEEATEAAELSEV